MITKFEDIIPNQHVIKEQINGNIKYYLICGKITENMSDKFILIKIDDITKNYKTIGTSFEYYYSYYLNAYPEKLTILKMNTTETEMAVLDKNLTYSSRLDNIE